MITCNQHARTVILTALVAYLVGAAVTFFAMWPAVHP